MAEELEDWERDDLILPPTHDSKPAALTYAQRRAKQISRGQDKGRVMSRKAREEEARETALARNLLTGERYSDGSGLEGESGSQSMCIIFQHFVSDIYSQIFTATGNKALDMMKKMGFKPGQALGKQVNTGSTDDGDSPLSTASDARTVPLDIHMRQGAFALPLCFIVIVEVLKTFALGRKGIGKDERPSKKRKVVIDGSGREIDEVAHEDQYLSTRRSAFDQRRAEGLLKGARRTCEELDRRNDIEENILWLDPVHIAQETKRKAHARRMGERVSDDEDYEDLNNQSNPEEVPLEDELVTEREQWLALDVSVFPYCRCKTHRRFIVNNLGKNQIRSYTRLFADKTSVRLFLKKKNVLRLTYMVT